MVNEGNRLMSVITDPASPGILLACGLYIGP